VKTLPKMDASSKKILVDLSTEVFEPQIRYTIDGTEPNIKSAIFKDPIEFSKSSTLKAGVFLNGKPIGKVIARQYDIHKAFGASISLKFPNSKRYDGFGEYNLVNGIRGTINHSDGSWTGFSKNDLIATIDLGSTMSINSIELEALEANASWIFLPKWVRFEVSTDGQDYQLLETINCPSQNTETLKRIYSFTTNIPATDIRYLRITAKNIEVCPPNHPAAGNPAWLFVSEIIVN
jgi:hexosaminidase